MYMMYYIDDNGKRVYTLKVCGAQGELDELST
jgi:hypothetical protein